MNTSLVTIAQQRFTASQLGPDPFFGAPDSLEALVKQVPAAVVAEIVGIGDRRFEEVSVPHSTKASLRGFATYRAVIRDVVFNKVQQQGPPLTVGSEIAFRQAVGRESAVAFTARLIPVAAGDECLLFLWLRPHGWDLLNWHLQFRKSRTISTAAEGLGPAGLMTFLSPKWLGTHVPYALDGENVKPDWSSLVTEVRRLGDQPSEPKIP